MKGNPNEILKTQALSNFLEQMDKSDVTLKLEDLREVERDSWNEIKVNEFGKRQNKQILAQIWIE